MATNKPIQLTDSEWDIIHSVWAKQPVSAVSVQEMLEKEKGWSYSTVKTLMDRMTEKGYLTTQRIRNLILYSAAITPEDAKNGALSKFLDKAFEGALSPMLHFLFDQKKLSNEELDELSTLIKTHRQKSKPKKRTKK